MHRFRYNQVFLLSGFIIRKWRHGVMAFSMLGDAAGNLYLRILKQRPRLYIHVSLTLQKLFHFVHLVRAFLGSFMGYHPLIVA